jgi:hypothetical protein
MALYLGSSKILSMGSNTSGSSITVDSELNPESMNPVQNKVITNYMQPALSNFIPENTVITVGADKQFQTIQSAYNSIEGKWSDGTVTIKIDDGTYTEFLDCTKMHSVPSLIITGTSKAGTIIKPNFTGDWQRGINFSSQNNITLKNLTYLGTGSRFDTGISVQMFSFVKIDNVLIKDTHYAGLRAYSGGKIYITGSGIDIENSSKQGQYGIMSNGGGMITGSWGVHVGIKNFTTGIRAEYSGTNTFESISYTNSSVTTPWSPTLNSTSAANAWNTNRA